MNISNSKQKQLLQEVIALRKARAKRSDFETPFNDMEMHFLRMASQKLEKHVNELSQDSPFKSMISTYLQKVQTVLKDNVLKPEEELYRKAKGIFRYANEYGYHDAGEAIVLTRTLAFLLGGHDRIVTKDQYLRLCETYKIVTQNFI